MGPWVCVRERVRARLCARTRACVRARLCAGDLEYGPHEELEGQRRLVVRVPCPCGVLEIQTVCVSKCMKGLKASGAWSYESPARVCV